MDENHTRNIYLKIIDKMVQELKKNKSFKKKLQTPGIEFIQEVF